MSYPLQFSEAVFATLEDLGHSDAKRLRQVFLKILSLRRSPRAPDSEQLTHFIYRGFTGFRVAQGEIGSSMRLMKRQGGEIGQNSTPRSGLSRAGTDLGYFSRVIL